MIIRRTSTRESGVDLSSCSSGETYIGDFKLSFARSFTDLETDIPSVITFSTKPTHYPNSFLMKFSLFQNRKSDILQSTLPRKKTII